MPIALLALLLIGGHLMAAEPGVWHDDYREAKQLAVEQDKPLLLEFTGLDWCPPCIRMHDNLLSTPKFRRLAAETFVLATIDFPKRHPQAKDIRRQNEKLAARYHIEGYPTIILTDASGRPFWIEMGAVREKPELYFQQLQRRFEQFKKYRKLRASAEKAPPGVNATLLADALRCLPESIVVRYYTEDLESLHEMDPTDSTGYRGHLDRQVKMAARMQELNQWFGEENYARIIQRVDQLIKDSDHDLKPTEAQQLLLRRAFACARLKNFSEAQATIGRMQALAPESDLGKRSGQLRAYIRHLKKKAIADKQLPPAPED